MRKEFLEEMHNFIEFRFVGIRNIQMGGLECEK